MQKKNLHTDHAPKAIGSYSQAIKHNNCLYVSGQIPLEPKTMMIVSEDIEKQIHQVFSNLRHICEAANSSLNHVLKLTIFVVDLECFPIVNEIMKSYFDFPYPARALVGIKALPKAAKIEIDAIVAL
jgi:reactive intermediate/imine deaminase